MESKVLSTTKFRKSRLAHNWIQFRCVLSNSHIIDATGATAEVTGEECLQCEYSGQNGEICQGPAEIVDSKVGKNALFTDTLRCDAKIAPNQQPTVKRKFSHKNEDLKTLETDSFIRTAANYLDSVSSF